LSSVTTIRFDEQGLFVNDEGMLCYCVIIMFEKIIFEVIGVDYDNGFYLLKEIKDGK
jgi:hypothetical protein